VVARWRCACDCRFRGQAQQPPGSVTTRRRPAWGGACAGRGYAATVIVLRIPAQTERRVVRAPAPNAEGWAVVRGAGGKDRLARPHFGSGRGQAILRPERPPHRRREERQGGGRSAREREGLGKGGAAASFGPADRGAPRPQHQISRMRIHRPRFVNSGARGTGSSRA